MSERFAGWFLGSAITTFILSAIYWIFIGYAHWHVWSSEMGGRSAMARAEQDRQILVREATAKRDAAKLFAEAEIERAKGVFEANKIVANGLGGPDGYLKYLYIQQLGNAEKNERTIIYVPTDGLIPVTEASRALTK